MIKYVYVFLFLLKINENNPYLFSQNYYPFDFVFKNYFQKIMAK